MNTPAHLVVNLALLGGSRAVREGRLGGWVAFGSVIPDLPMFGFYFFQKVAAGRSEATIWAESYFDPQWQGFFDVFNSLPLALCAGLLAWQFGKPALAWLCASVALHAALDLPVHREDAHRHFLPLSDWRFESPVSYWDPAHHGALGAGIETVAVIACAWILWHRTDRRLARAALVAISALYVAGYAAIYGAGLGPAAC